MDKHFMFRSIVVAVLILAVSCTQDSVSNKPTDIGQKIAGISGKLFTPAQRPAAHVAIKLLPQDFIPWLSQAKKANPSGITDISYTFYTDSQGVYTLPLPDSGTYNLFGQIDSLMVYISRISVHDTQDISVPVDTVRLPGKIKGFTKLKSENDTDQVRVTLYIPGTKWITKPGIGGSFNFDALPQGTYQLIVAPDLDNYKVKVLDISISAGKTLNLDTIMLESNAVSDIIYRDTSRAVSIIPDAHWHSAGQSISLGNILVVKASGTIASPTQGSYGPSGGSALGGLSYLLVNQPIYALFARIGDGAPFKIGSSFIGTAQGTGDLQFAVNSLQGVVIIPPPGTKDTTKNGPEVIIDTTASTGETGKFIIDSLVIRRK
jgi:hypothetical protein